MKKSPLRKAGKQKKSVLKRKAWESFRDFIKKRDRGNCYTCPAKNCVKQNYQAGHYPPGSVLPESEYFNPKLVHGQCFRCNINLSGNPVAYRKNLILEWGQEFVEEIEAKCGKPNPLSHEELIAIADYYKQLST